MNERFASDLLFILIVLIVAALLGFIIGYLLRKKKNASFQAMEKEIQSLNAKLAGCMEKIQQPVHLFDAESARKVFGQKIIENDLKIIEGIGVKIEEMLKTRGISTWQKLSVTSADEIRNILLSDGGPSYAMHEPQTWSAQSLMACEGKWKELKEYQDKLKGGRL
ncbi:MAG: hypothetical protein JXA61_04005 [Bacteroidales bacterium]|nr:hypothetical protein [Bacteroidales bacterium]